MMKKDRSKVVCLYPDGEKAAVKGVKEWSEEMLTAVFAEPGGGYGLSAGADFYRERRRVGNYRAAAEAAVRVAFPSVRTVVHHPEEVSVSHIRRQEAFNDLNGGELGFVAVYFNPCGYNAPRANFERFIERFDWMKDRLLVVELAFGDQAFSLTDRAGNLLQLRSDSVLWQKEALINVGTQILRERGFVNVGWLDGDTDIQNCGEDWFECVCRALDESAAVQVAEKIICEFTDQRQDSLGAAANFIHGRLPIEQIYKTGLGWAVRGELWDGLGWYEDSVIGAGDQLAFLATVGAAAKAGQWAQFNNNAKYLEGYQHWATEWSDRVGGAVGFVKDYTALAEPHGSHSNRQYHSRELILSKFGFDPGRDLLKATGSPLEWSANAAGLLRTAVLDHFYQRREDG
ncbi:MAG: hypothetical protein QM496_01870 [Verrucomicrobiota bacterium]